MWCFYQPVLFAQYLLRCISYVYIYCIFQHNNNIIFYFSRIQPVTFTIYLSDTVKVFFFVFYCPCYDYAYIGWMNRYTYLVPIINNNIQVYIIGSFGKIICCKTSGNRFVIEPSLEDVIYFQILRWPPRSSIHARVTPLHYFAFSKKKNAYTYEVLVRYLYGTQVGKSYARVCLI